MGDVLTIFSKVLKGGFKTSEFWLSVAALFVPLIDSWVQHLRTSIDIAQQQPHNAWVTLGYAVAAAVVASVYSVVRGKLKADTANAVSLASAVAGEAAGIPPVATNGNIGTAAK